jgi:hypothetical protein
MLGISSVAAQLAVSQKGFSSMKLVMKKHSTIRKKKTFHKALANKKAETEIEHR